MLTFSRLSLLAASVALALPAFAAEKSSPPVTDNSAETKTNKSDTLSVVGNWLDNTDNSTVVLNHPGARTIVTQQRIHEKGAQTVGDSLRGIPGVQVRESNGTGGSDISLNVGVRGLTSRLSPRSTILMDGIPLAVAPYGRYPASSSTLWTATAINGSTFYW